MKVLSIEIVYVPEAKKAIRFARTLFDYEAGKISNVVHEIKGAKKWEKVTPANFVAETEKARLKVLQGIKEPLNPQKPPTKTSGKKEEEEDF